MAADILSVLPLDPNLTFEQLEEINKRYPGSVLNRSKLTKAIVAHPAFKKVVADLNTGERGRNYSYLKKPNIKFGDVNKIYKEVKARDEIATTKLNKILSETGDDVSKLTDAYEKLTGKESGAKVRLEDKIRSTPEYKEFLKYDEKGFKPSSKTKSLEPSREFLRFKTFLKFTRTLPEGTKFSDYTSLPDLSKDLRPELVKSIVSPKRVSLASPGRYRFFDYKTLEKVLGSAIKDERGTEYFKTPTESVAVRLKRFFKDGTSLSGKYTEDIVKTIHGNEELKNMLSAKNFPSLADFKAELEKALGGGGNKYVELTNSQVAHGTRIYSDWTKGDVYKNMGLEFKPTPKETRLGNKIYAQLQGFKRNNPWSKGEYQNALREIKLNMPDRAGSLSSFKTTIKNYLPEGFLTTDAAKRNLNVNEIFSVTASARNKAYPYAYFVDVIDADINQKNLANFQGKLSTAVSNTRNIISRLRAGDKTVSYKDLEKTIFDFQNQRKTFSDTIKKNFSGKNFNLPDIVLGTESEILSNDFNIADKVYSSKNLQKWKDQGIDIAKHAKTEGYAMTGADKKTTFLFRDLVNTSKDLFKKASAPEQYEIAFKLGCVGGNADGGRIGFALGTGTVTCVNKKLADETHLPKLTALDDSSPLLGKMKNAASTFFNVAKKGGRFGALAAVGAAAAGLVKEFRNDDPSTYLSSENQQKNMLIDMLEQPIVTPTETPSTALGDATLPAIGAVTAAGMIPGGAELYKQRTGAGSRKRTGAFEFVDNKGAKVLQKRVSPFRAATGPLSGVLGKGLAATGTPLGMLALEPLYIGQQIAEGDSFGEIATNPINYLGPAFAGSLSKEATRFAGPTMSNIMRLGISPTTLKTVSRRFGLPGLALSAGVSGYEMYQNKKAGRGLFDDG